MKRIIYPYLEDWKKNDERKPLIIRGARQVGKTFIVRLLGESFEDFLEINFEERNDVKKIFEKDLVPDRILRELSLIFKKKIIPGKFLLFFDEIQECPRAIIFLRYLYEKKPDLHVIAAGSLLEFATEFIGMPVGRVSSLYLYPFSFMEFLKASNEELLIEEILNHNHLEPISDVIHNKLLDLLGVFLAIGGMPQIIQSWIKNQDPLKCFNLQNGILDSYRQDFNKYAKKYQIKYLDLLFEHVPIQMGKIFKFSNVASEYRKRELSPCLDLLIKASVAHKIIHSSGNGIPIGSEVNIDKFKLIFLDIALAQSQLGLDLGSWFIDSKQEFINKGAVVEAFVGQELMAYSLAYKKASLFYWQRDARSSKAEVDYLIQLKNQIIPIEVKSNFGTTLKSLKMFLEKNKASQFGIRFSAHNYSVHENVLSYPLYAIIAPLKYKHEIIKRALLK